MNRRKLITLLGGAAATWPMVARGQSMGRLPTIGYLSSASPDAQRHASFRRGLAEHDYVEGQNVIINFRWAESQYGALPNLFAELERSDATIIFAGGNQAALAVKTKNSAIPCVFVIGDDPVELGLVQSFNRPASNMTGVTFYSSALAGKRLEILHELAPPNTTIGMLVNPATPATKAQRNIIEAAAQRLGRRVEFFEAGNVDELENALVALVGRRVGGFFYNSDPFFNSERRRLIAFASYNRMPAVYSGREYSELGGLISYGAPQQDAYRQAGNYAGRILNGEKPADLPVMQPLRFELILNLKTAQKLGITFSPRVLALADEVIE